MRCEKIARVIKGVGGRFVVRENDQNYIVSARKKCKQDRILVGDNVTLDLGLGVIERLLPRKNELVRPPVANVEQVLLILAPVPKPDFLLVDKLIIKYLSLGIQPIIVVNKLDLEPCEKSSRSSERAIWPHLRHSVCVCTG